MTLDIYIKNKALKKILFFLFIGIGLMACKQSKLEHALQLAGENRTELEKILEHYSKSKGDELKYKAACFLIENMAYRVSYENENLDKVISNVYLLSQEIYRTSVDLIHSQVAEIAFDSVNKTPLSFRKLNYINNYDSQIINADFFIKNIDLAFKIWYEVPWHNKISFQQFCTDILPYRVANEEIQDWREMYYNRFIPIIQNLPEGAGYIEACNILYDTLQSEAWYHVDETGAPYLGACTMLKNRFGSCRDRAAFTIYAMRAIGIPGHLDIILQNPEKMYSYHYWNHIEDYDGNPIEFLIGDINLRPVVGSVDTARKKGIVYRLSFDVQENSVSYLFINKDVPERLENPFLKNVSAEYFPDSQIKISINKENKKNDIVYLCLFNNREWIPVVGSKIDNNNAVFNGLESGVVYLPAFYLNGKIMPVNYPFLVKDNNNVHYLNPDTVNKEKIQIHRKHPLAARFFLKKTIWNGYFQGANKPDFSDAETFYSIDNHFDLKRADVKLDTQGKYRYVRYLSADSAYCNMAEIKFYTEDRKELKGKIIGTDGSLNQNPAIAKYAVFDNDPLTYFAAPIASGGWVGLDFGKKEKISEISFQFRNDDNLIREGEQYELFYFTKNGPVSLGEKIGTESQYLEYDNVPLNSLLWLRNYSRGREERIFTYENGKQVWW